MINVPNIFKGRTGYLIMVDRFCRVGESPKEIEGRKLKDWSDASVDWQPENDGEYRNRSFYGGNLKGIESKIDYFKKLGVDIIFLSPISQTNSYHHYDVGDDQGVIDPYIGTWSDFKHLAAQLHKKNMLLGVDLVFNHRAVSSECFKKAMDGDSKYEGWFEKDDSGNPTFWYGFKELPQCNKLNAEYQDKCCEEIKPYVRGGADIIRLDLGETFPKEFLTKIRATAKEINPNIIIVSEMWSFALKRENPQIYDNQVDSVMNYPLTDAILRWVRYGNYLHLNACIENLAKYPVQVHDVLLNYLCTHDTPRERNMLVGDAMLEDPFAGSIWDIESRWQKPHGFDTYEFRKWESENDNNFDQIFADKLQKLAALIQYLMKGIPVIFYGSEVGMCGYKDPFCRKQYPWENGNQEIFRYYTGLGIMRTSNKDVLSTGDMYINATSTVLQIVRRSAAGIIVGFINRSNEYQSIEATYPGAKEIFSLEGSNQNTLTPYGAYVSRF